MLSRLGRSLLTRMALARRWWLCIKQKLRTMERFSPTPMEDRWSKGEEGKGRVWGAKSIPGPPLSSIPRSLWHRTIIRLLRWFQSGVPPRHQTHVYNNYPFISDGMDQHFGVITDRAQGGTSLQVHSKTVWNLPKCLLIERMGVLSWWFTDVFSTTITLELAKL